MLTGQLVESQVMVLSPTLLMADSSVATGKGPNDKVADRIGFYKRYCDLFRIGYGNNLDCYNQRPFA